MGGAECSELAGLSFQCREGCALCCLCQAQLGVEDLGQWQGQDEVESRGGEWFFRLRNGDGPCINLHDRRCAHYRLRPYVCRAFPFHLFAGWRLQAYADRSCPGIGKGAGVEGEVQALLESIPKSVRQRVENDGRAAYHEYKVESSHRQMYRSPRDVRKDVEGFIKDPPLAAEPDELREMARAVFEQAERTNLPVYIDPQLRWNVFEVRGPNVFHLELTNEGEYGELDKMPLDRVPAPEFTPAAMKGLRDYLNLLNGRDILYCEAARYCMEGGYKVPVGKIYQSLLDDIVLDLVLRSGLLMAFCGHAEADAQLVEELVRFYDWDVLDRNGVGRWL